MGVIQDISQDEKIKRLEQKIKRLEGKKSGGNEMSNIINQLVGMECEISTGGYDTYKGRVTETDSEWVKLAVSDRKGEYSVIVRIDDIASVKVF